MALDYAIDLVNAAKGKLHLVTSYFLPSSAGAFHSIDRQVHDAMTSDLEEVILRVTPKITSGYKITYDALEGTPSGVISAYATHHNIDLIVMGTKGSSSVKNLVVGSTTLKVVNNGQTPVLAIHKESSLTLQNNGQILLCLDAQGISSIKNITFLRELKNLTEKPINVLHVSKEKDTIDLSENSGKIFDFIDEIFDVKGDDAVLEIKNFALHNNADMIVMVPRRHSFWSSLFSESHSEGELFATNIPILFLPE
ncbi:MAG: universal stress protein [Saprospiraceae bacterium]